jgi:hypothetical protein
MRLLSAVCLLFVCSLSALCLPTVCRLCALCALADSEDCVLRAAEPQREIVHVHILLAVIAKLFSSLCILFQSLLSPFHPRYP